jgi:hypothetical protein
MDMPANCRALNKSSLWNIGSISGLTGVDMLMGLGNTTTSTRKVELVAEAEGKNSIRPRLVVPVEPDDGYEEIV